MGSGYEKKRKKFGQNNALEKVSGSAKSIGFFLLVETNTINVSFVELLVTDKQPGRQVTRDDLWR